MSFEQNSWTDKNVLVEIKVVLRQKGLDKDIIAGLITDYAKDLHYMDQKQRQEHLENIQRAMRLTSTDNEEFEVVMDAVQKLMKRIPPAVEGSHNFNAALDDHYSGSTYDLTPDEIRRRWEQRKAKPTFDDTLSQEFGLEPLANHSDWRMLNPEKVGQIDQFALKYGKFVAQEVVRSIRNLKPGFEIGADYADTADSDPVTKQLKEELIASGKSVSEITGILSIKRYFEVNEAEGHNLFDNGDNARKCMRQWIIDNLIEEILSYEKLHTKSEVLKSCPHPMLRGKIKEVIAEYGEDEYGALQRLRQLLRSPGNLVN